MQANRIDAIFHQAQATAASAELPQHIRSLATTIERMVTRIAGDPAPTRADLFTLEQAVRILDRWVADHHGTAPPPDAATCAAAITFAAAIESPAI
jgi:hypothetical protein